MKSKGYCILFLLSCIAAITHAQNFHALQGSSFAGSAAIADNPATMLSSPYKWDFMPLGIQLKNSTNAMRVENYSLLSSPANSMYAFNSGEFGRFAHVNANVNLLNARYAINRRNAIGIGMNVRSYTKARTGGFNFIDTLSSMNDFFKINDINNKYSGHVTSTSWIEIFLAYSRTIFETETRRLNAGITLKASRGIAGGFLNLQNGTVSSSVQGSKTIYNLASASAQYGYSSNFDLWKTEKSSGQNIRDFLNYTQGGASIDLGVEYIMKEQTVKTFNDDDDYYDYDWKIGVSILDIGWNQYKNGVEGRRLSGVNTSITDLDLDNKFDSIGSFREFNDSIQTVSGWGYSSGIFKVTNPMRFVVNADRNLHNDFYVNATLTINLAKYIDKKAFYARDLNLLTVTPRWETRRWGVYMPMLFNNEGQFWVGGAFKAGPLLLGVHNWANVFSKKKIQNGGGYLALIFHAKSGRQEKTDKRLNCPPGL